MARFCLRKEKIDDVISSIKSLKGGMRELLDMSGEDMTKVFSKTLPEKEAQQLATEFMRGKTSVRVRALGDIVRKNFDTKYRAKMLKAQQRRTINNYLENKLYKTTSPSEIISTKDVMRMSPEKRDTFLRKYYSEDERLIVNEQIKRTEEIIKIERQEKLQSKAKNEADTQLLKLQREGLEAMKKQQRAQMKVINNLFKEKPVFRQRKTKSIDEIVSMKGAERIDFLRKQNPKGVTAEELNREILKFSESPLEKQIKRSLSKETNFAEMKAFVDDKIDEVVNAKNGISLSEEQVRKVMSLSKDIREKQAKYAETKDYKDAIEAQMAVRQLGHYTATIKGAPTKMDWLISSLGIPRLLFATGELSSMLIQGGQMTGRLLMEAVTDPKLFHKKYVGAFRTLNWKDPKESALAYERAMAEFSARETASVREKAGLHVTDMMGGINRQEEDFITRAFTLLEDTKIPTVQWIGTAGKAVFDPFSRFHSLWLNQLRIERFDSVYYALKKTGVEVDKDFYKYLASTINDVTGGSKLGKAEIVAPEINALAFSIRKVVGDIKTLSVRPVKDTYKAILSKNKAEKMIAIDSLKTLASGYAVIGTVFGLFKWISQNNENVTVETNPTSADFGEVRIGNTRQNIMGSKDWFVTLSARMIMEEYKSSTTGLISEYGSGFGKKDRVDAIFDVVRSKASPNLAIILDGVAKENIIGEKFFNGMTGEEWVKFVKGDESVSDKAWDGIKQEAFNRLLPMAYQSIIDMQEDDLELTTRFMMISGTVVGAGTRTYGLKKNWEWEDTKEKQQFQEKFGYTETAKAGDKHSELINKEWEAFMKTKEFKEMDNEERKKKLTSITLKTKKEIFKEYKFVPKD